MIRVIYRWRVAPENFAEFRQVWSETTNRIHATVPGARGSFMLRSHDHDSVVLTIARWDSLESWKDFFGNANPKEMGELRRLGERIAVEAYDEIEDYTR